jgi:hypothetical protein
LYKNAKGFEKKLPKIVIAFFLSEIFTLTEPRVAVVNKKYPFSSKNISKS